MLFNSYPFLFLFLPIVLFAYWRVGTQRRRQLVLVTASYVFYGVWSVWFAVLMLATTSVDFFTAQRIEKARPDAQRARRWLIVSLVANLGVLGIFKYYGFFARNLNALLPSTPLPGLDLLLPIGISFYTFESMSYTIDVYRGKIPALRHFIDYAHFVTMFPRLVAGPIVRYADLRAQLQAETRVDSHQALEGIHYFALGLMRKVFLADYIALHVVDPSFGNAAGLALVPAWIGALGYTAQLYLDFSAYSDMAIGLGLMLGLRLPANFRRPYCAASIGEFWRRWHISLSTWLRDYLYIPLGGNQGTRVRTYVNLFLTMLLGGLWHGANWTFVVWGAYHGCGVAATHARRNAPPSLPRPIGVALTFAFVVVGWVMFRAASVENALAYYRCMMGVNGLGADWMAANAGSAAVLALGLLISFRWDTSDIQVPLSPMVAGFEGLAFALCISKLGRPSPFLYFQF